MDILVLCTGMMIVGFTAFIPGGDCVSSPLHTHHYAYDIIMDIESYVHHRKRRRTGRGNSIDTWACDTITAVPEDIRTDFPLNDFYQKYTHAYGIPIVSSSTARDAALTRACYDVRFLLADRQDIRDAMFDMYGRVGVIAESEMTTDIPEHSHLPESWNDRARGLGGIPSIPITTDGEENILCIGFPNDRWYEEDVLIHEFAHAIHLISMNRINSSFQQALKDIHNQAKAENLWPNTYAIYNYIEYFAEGVQSFFNVQTCRGFVDHIHNDICTREALKNYDRRLYDLIVEIFPCMNTIVNCCEPNQNLAANQSLRMNCDVPGINTSPAPDSTTTPAEDYVTSPITDSVTRPITDFVTSPITDYVTSPVTDSVTRPTTDSVTRPITDSVTNHITDSVTADYVTNSWTDLNIATRNDSVSETLTFSTDATSQTEIHASGALGTCYGQHQIFTWALFLISCLINY